MPHTIPTTIHWHGLSLPCRVDPHWQDAVPAGDPSIDDRPEWDAYHPGVEPTPENIRRILDANSWELECRAVREARREHEELLRWDEGNVSHQPYRGGLR